jgi:hypothetical protein
LTERFVYDNQDDFLGKLKELIKSGVDPESIDVRAPHVVHGLEEVMKLRPSHVRLFALFGGLFGAFTGYAFTSFTVIDWPLISGGKPMVSIPPFTVIAFELMVLFGALFSFAGFALMSRLPAVRTIISDDEYGDNFEINVKREG